MSNGASNKTNLLSFQRDKAVDQPPRELWDGEDDEALNEAFSTANANASVVNTMRALVLFMAKTMVNFDNLVEVNIMTHRDSTILVISVEPVDAGKLIGRNGRTARSMRTILTAASRKYNARFLLDISIREPLPSDEGDGTVNALR